MHCKLDTVVFHLMRKILQEHTSAWQQVLPELTKPQFAVLHAVSTHPGIEQIELTEVAVSTKATLADLLARLEKRGFIVRRQRIHDKRRRFVYLTPEGEALVNSVEHLVQQVDQAFLSRLSDVEQHTFLKLLMQMADGHQDEPEPSAP